MKIIKFLIPGIFIGIFNDIPFVGLAQHIRIHTLLWHIISWFFFHLLLEARLIQTYMCIPDNQNLCSVLHTQYGINVGQIVNIHVELIHIHYKDF